MSTRADGRIVDDGPCAECLEIDARCRRCAGRAVYAMRSLYSGKGIVEIAARLRVAPWRAQRLVDDELDRRSLQEHKKDPLVADAQAKIDRALEREPGLTRAGIARRMKPEMHPADFDRTFGYARSRGAGSFISVEMGNRLMLALGLDPRDLDGC